MRVLNFGISCCSIQFPGSGLLVALQVAGCSVPVGWWGGVVAGYELQVAGLWIRLVGCGLGVLVLCLMVQGADRRICGCWFTDGRLKIPVYRKNGLRVMDGRLKALGCRLLAKRRVLFVLDDVMIFEMWIKGGNLKSLSIIHSLQWPKKIILL